MRGLETEWWLGDPFWGLMAPFHPIPHCTFISGYSLQKKQNEMF